MIVPSCRLLEWCYLLAFSFCHRQLQICPLVNWSVLQDSKWITNASRVNPLWVQGVSIQTAGTAFASCIFSSSLYAATSLLKQSARKKSLNWWKKNKPPLHDSSYSHLYPHVSHETLIPIPGQQQMLAEGWHKHGDKHLNTLLWILTMTGHGSSWCRDLPARRQLSVGCVPPKTSLTGWRGGRGGTHKRGDRVFPGQAGACQGHFLTAISI